MTDLDRRLLALGQPDLEDDDEGDPARGFIIGCALGGLAWMVICGLAWWAVWG